MFVPLASGIILSQFLLYRKTRAKLSILFTAAVCISSIVILIATVNPLIQDYHAISFPKEETVSVAQDLANKAETVKTIASGRNILFSIVNYLVLPYPGSIDIADIQGNKKVEFIVAMDMVAWYVCLVLMLTGIYAAFRRRKSCLIGLLAFTASYVFINAVVVENVADTIYRYRSVIIGTSLLLIDGNVFKNITTRFANHMRLRSYAGKPGHIGSYSVKQ